MPDPEPDPEEIFPQLEDCSPPRTNVNSNEMVTGQQAQPALEGFFSEFIAFAHEFLDDVRRMEENNIVDEINLPKEDPNLEQLKKTITKRISRDKNTTYMTTDHEEKHGTKSTEKNVKVILKILEHVCFYCGNTYTHPRHLLRHFKFKTFVKKRVEPFTCQKLRCNFHFYKQQHLKHHNQIFDTVEQSNNKCKAWLERCKDFFYIPPTSIPKNHQTSIGTETSTLRGDTMQPDNNDFTPN